MCYIQSETLPSAKYNCSFTESTYTTDCTSAESTYAISEFMSIYRCKQLQCSNLNTVIIYLLILHMQASCNLYTSKNQLYTSAELQTVGAYIQMTRCCRIFAGHPFLQSYLLMYACRTLVKYLAAGERHTERESMV